MLTFPNTPKPQISSGVTIIQQQTTESDKVLPNHVIQGTFTCTGMMTATPSTQLLKTRFVVHWQNNRTFLKNVNTYVDLQQLYPKQQTTAKRSWSPPWLILFWNLISRRSHFRHVMRLSPGMILPQHKLVHYMCAVRNWFRHNHSLSWFQVKPVSTKNVYVNETFMWTKITNLTLRSDFFTCQTSVWISHGRWQDKSLPPTSYHKRCKVNLSLLLDFEMYVTYIQ